MGQWHNHDGANQQTDFHLSAKLPGFLFAFNFPTFPPLVWPGSTFQTWFKAHGSAPQLQLVSSFGEFSFFQKQVAEKSLRVASSASSSLSHLLENPLPTSAPGSPEVSPATMANIPIDPRPFVSHGFEIQHIEGRVGVKGSLSPGSRGFTSSTPSPPSTLSLKVRYTFRMFEMC
jgi:hypothetical protein